MGAPTLNSTAEIVQQLLINLGLGISPPIPPNLPVPGTWPVYATGEPNEPDNVLSVLDSVDQYDGRSMVDGEVWDHYGFQVRVRASDHPTAYKKAFALKVALAQQVNYVPLQVPSNVGTGLISYVVHCVSKLNVRVLGKDAPNSRRTLCVVNGLLAFS